MLKAATAQAIYTETLEDLKAAIEATGSVAAFCRDNNIDRPNLVRAFSALHGGHDKKLSLGTYIRICVGLGIMGKENLAPEENPKAFDNIPLDTYILINHSNVANSILTIKFL